MSPALIPSSALDRLGQTVDFLLTAQRDVAAARHFFERAIGLHDEPEKITIDKSGANTASRALIDDRGTNIDLRQSKYLNTLVEQDHRAIKRRVRSMLGFKSFRSPTKILAGIETMHMIKKGSLPAPKAKSCPLPTSSTASPSNPAPPSRFSLAHTDLL